MKPFIYIIFVIPFLIGGCSCEREKNDGFEVTSPGWVSTQFYKAYADKDYYSAMDYCDKASEDKLEIEYYYSDNIADIDFVKVDSCDEYQDHAYCYCNYIEEDSLSKTDKLLLRNFNGIWKVHYDPETSKGESNLYSNKADLRDDYSESPAPITEIIMSNLDSVINESIRIINHTDVVVGFLSPYDLADVCRGALKESSYDDHYVKRTYLDRLEASSTFYFTSGMELNRFEMVVLDVDSWKRDGVYQYMIDKLISEYGAPYNSGNIPTNELYKYKEIKWFLKGYNEELILSGEFFNLTLSLIEAQ